MDSAGYIARLGKILLAMRNFQMTVGDSDWIEDTVSGRIVVQATGKAETAAGPYFGNYILILSFDSAGEKLTKVVEMVDSKTVLDFFPALKARNGAPKAE